MEMKTTIILLFLSLNIYSKDKFEDYLLIGNDTVYLTTGFSGVHDSIIFTGLHINDTIEYVLPKDTFIEYEANKWYNESTREYIDSTSYYNWKPNFVKMLKEYRQDCYNDSTFTVYDWYQFPGEKKFNVPIRIDPGFTPSYLGRWGIWEHKQPTFEDFLNWIDK